MYIVLVLVTVKTEKLAEFEDALLTNARESVAKDVGCVRFDVSQDIENPARWVLHEVYETPDAHAAHRQSPHFLAYDVIAREVITEKQVLRCAGKHVPR